MKNIYTSTKFVRVNADHTYYPEWEHVFPVAIPDNKDYQELLKWGDLRQFVKKLNLDILPMVVYPHECQYNDGECHHCDYCYEKAEDEEEILIPVYSYGLSWEQNRRLLSAFCDAWGVYDISGVYAFINYHRRSLNKTCGRGWTDSLIKRIRREYYSSF